MVDSEVYRETGGAIGRSLCMWVVYCIVRECSGRTVGVEVSKIADGQMSTEAKNKTPQRRTNTMGQTWSGNVT